MVKSIYLNTYLLSINHLPIIYHLSIIHQPSIIYYLYLFIYLSTYVSSIIHHLSIIYRLSIIYQPFITYYLPIILSPICLSHLSFSLPDMLFYQILKTSFLHFHQMSSQMSLSEEARLGNIV